MRVEWEKKGLREVVRVGEVGQFSLFLCLTCLEYIFTEVISGIILSISFYSNWRLHPLKSIEHWR